MNIRELAQLAGVSKSTAAYAIKNNPRVKAEVRERVQKLAKEHGYEPNPLVKAYMNEMRRGEAFRKRLFSLCYVTSMREPNSPISRLQAYEFERIILQGAKDEAEALGYPLEVITLNPACVSSQRINQIIAAKGIRGVFVGPGTTPFADLLLNVDQLAAITYGYTVSNPELDRIAADLLQAVIDMARVAFNRKYRTIIFAIDHENDDRVGNRWSSGAGALREFHGDHKIRIVRDENNCLPAKIVPLIKNCEAPAVCGFSSLIDLLRPYGVRVPEDIGFVALNNDALPHHADMWTCPF